MLAPAIMVRGMVRHGRIFRRFLVRRLLVGRLGILVPRIAIMIAVIAVAGLVAFLSLHRAHTACGSTAAIQLRLSLIPHLLELRFLPVLQVTAELGALAVVLAALRQFAILTTLQTVDLVVEVPF